MSEHNISITLRSNEQITIEIKQSSSTNKHRNFKQCLGCDDKTLYDWLTLLSSILLPFAIAIFTIAITMQENREQRENRERDLEIAALRREQDRLIAEQQRNETILSNYLKDTSSLILKYGYHLSDHRAHITASSMALTALQQLNIEKKQFLIRYLHRMTFIDQIQTDYPITLAGADLANLQLIDFFAVKDRSTRKFDGLYLPSVYLTNALLMNLKIQYSNFDHSDLSGVNFTYSFLQYANFRSAQLQDCDFSFANVTHADFQHANLTGSNINDRQLQQAAFLDYVTFPNGSLFLNKNRYSNVLLIDNWIYQHAYEKNIFNRSINFYQKTEISIYQNISLQNYAKPYWIDRERIMYILSSVMHGHNIFIEILFFNSNNTLIQSDHLEHNNTNHTYHETRGICRRNTHLIRVEMTIKQSEGQAFVEYIHLNLTSQFNMNP